MKDRKVVELIELLNEYGTAKFGDEWWPGHAGPHIGKKKGRRLENLLDQVGRPPKPKPVIGTEYGMVEPGFAAVLAREAQRAVGETGT